MSRLKKNSDGLRNQLITRNLYTPTDIYDIDNPKLIEAINSISNLINPSNSFDFSNTIIGRVIGPQTPITTIGRKALANMYSYQVRSIAATKLLPTININNLFTGKNIFEKKIDFSITKENSDNIKDKIFNTLKDFSGINSLKNPITDNITTEDLIKNFTGIAQKQQLETLLSQNIFSNNFNNSLSVDNSKSITSLIALKSESKLFKDNIRISRLRGIDGNFIVTNLSERYFKNRYSSKFYATETDDINQQDIDKTFGSSNEGFTWGIDATSDIFNSKGILGYTNALFNSLNVNNNAPFNKTVGSITVNDKKYYNGIDVENRSYSINNQMDSYGKTIKPIGYSQDNRNNSVLYKRPIPKINFDVITDGLSVTNNVMFSIENLAYSYDNSIDDPYERGINDGRIMWFSPTIINFNETVTPNINPINFIGRGEPVYTYSNTERKFDITFHMVADYVEELVGVSNINEFKNRLYSAQTNNKVNNKNIKVIDNGKKIRLEAEQQKKIIELSNILNIGRLPLNLYYNYNEIIVNSDDNYKASLDDIFKKINEFYENFEDSSKINFEINIMSYGNDFNDNIVIERINNFQTSFNTYYNTYYPNLINKLNIIFDYTNTTLINTNNSANSEIEISKRYISITSVVPIISDNDNDIQIDNITSDVIPKIIPNILVDTYDPETKNGTSSKIIEKRLQNGLITYTPYDIYKRMTFLHQCTRQGKTQLKEGISNAVYGRPPIIIFKLGDMYNTKAIITSLSFSFDEEMPWDLNPEGFGVQKMGCKVTLNMNLIGASAIDGPKSHIVNADSVRYYANSSFDSKVDKEES